MIRKIIRIGKSELLVYVTTWKYLEHHLDVGKIATWPNATFIYTAK
jgi:hypothetical protein